MEFREWLESKGLGQSEFSRMFNIPLRTVQHWAEGDRKPPEYVIEMAEKIIESEKKR